MNRYGNVSIENAVNADQIIGLIQTLNLTPPVLVKPNWGTVECFTGANVLDWTLSAIPGEKLVIESHGWARGEETLLQQPVSLTKSNLRKGDRWFLEYSKINSVLAKHQVEYLNLTEEIWAGRIADPMLIKAVVEAKFAPVQFEDHYARVPSRLYDLRGGTLLSLSKHKIVFYPLGVSLSIKNLFGLIPGPSRGKYHGKDHAFLDQSIVDINKVYRSLFKVSGVIESLPDVAFLEKEGEPTRLKPGCRLVFASDDMVSMDALASAVSGRNPGTVGHIRLAGQNFGAWDQEAIKQAVLDGVKVF